ncbi:unnamed protein product [Rhizopus stolonifer]
MDHYQQTMSQKDVPKINNLFNNDYNFQQNLWTPADNSNELITNPVACDLRDVIVYYQSQPELLRLILQSKVEEDKRRTEEARLRAKELDMLLFKQEPYPDTVQNNTFQDTFPETFQETFQETYQNTFQDTFQDLMTLDERRPSAIDLLLEEIHWDRRDSALGSSFDGSSNSNDELEDTLSPMLSMSFPPQSMASVANQNSASPLFNLPTKRRLLKTRRRREMQAITKIVETRESPYNDGFLWKNNGNTIQKKTGNKSIYYKCSNSTKGCPVNKTVTAKEHGEFLIKYRGEHLLECGKVQRIVEV